MNRELVSKPYKYIDKVKEDILKDWVTTKNKLKANNEKYMGKFVYLETNVDKLITKTETLVDQYKKKINNIGADLDSIKTIKDLLEAKVKGNRSQLDEMRETYDSKLGSFAATMKEMKSAMKKEINNMKEESYAL